MYDSEQMKDGGGGKKRKKINIIYIDFCEGL